MLNPLLIDLSLNQKIYILFLARPTRVTFPHNTILQ